ncbi:MAG: CoA transferase [Burkholderiales bacterium]|nr:CoA transferase [Burkholderiales bacterium]
MRSNAFDRWVTLTNTGRTGEQRLDSNSTRGGALCGVRVLDLSRILAGPACTQVLGDLGADVIKVERPGDGDDTRRWGPPFVRDAHGRDTTESAYYLSTNRNKRSIAIDLSAAQGQRLVRALAERSDVLIENHKVGALARFGLGYAQLRESHPKLVYCSITGFGQDGPYAQRTGYDFLAQGMGGIMSVTGAPDGEPMKVGVGITDVMTGMYAAIAILAALRHRDASGQGQHVDLALLDTQVAWLINAGQYYLTSGEVPPRLGNGHPNIVPYEVFPASDGYFILAVGNDAQFRRLCECAEVAELADDPRFASNASRVRNRDVLVPMLKQVTARRAVAEWVQALERLQVPCGPVNRIDQVFADPQVVHRGMRVTLDYPGSAADTVDLIGSPIRLSDTPVQYRRPPPRLGQHTDEVLREVLGIDDAELRSLRTERVLA